MTGAKCVLSRHEPSFFKFDSNLQEFVFASPWSLTVPSMLVFILAVRIISGCTHATNIARP